MENRIKLVAVDFVIDVCREYPEVLIDKQSCQ